MDWLGLGLRVFYRRDDLTRATKLIRPAANALRAELPELIPLVKNLWTEFAPYLDVDLKPPVRDVHYLQRALNKLGANPQLLVDGDEGPSTQAAVRSYQEKHGLTVDGWAMTETMASIEHELLKIL